MPAHPEYPDSAQVDAWCDELLRKADRLGFFGSSQGGGTALLLGSLLRDRSVKAVAADVPFLTNFPMMRALPDKGAYHLAFNALAGVQKSSPERIPECWRALGLVDTMSHAHRLTMPVLLTAGMADNVCPPPTIRALFDALPGTRSYTELAGQGHTYTVPFLRLAAAWFGLYL